MPEFILDHGTLKGAQTFRALDSFTQGYVTAMFFTDCEHGTFRADPDESPADIGGNVWNPETQSNLPGNVTFADLAPETLARIIEDCRDFQTSDAASDLLFGIYESDIDYSPERAGNDFWYSRNGHGTGFWDRGLGDIGDKLHKAAKVYGACDTAMGDDNLIYLS